MVELRITRYDSAEKLVWDLRRSENLQKKRPEFVKIDPRQ
jgi:hypothetical protein